MNDNLSFLLKELNVQWDQSNLFLYDELSCNYPSMCVIGSLICNQNDKLLVILTILFLQYSKRYISIRRVFHVYRIKLLPEMRG